MANALHREPQSRARIAGGTTGSRELFVQEVHRFYPFFPLWRLGRQRITAGAAAGSLPTRAWC